MCTTSIRIASARSSSGYGGPAELCQAYRCGGNCDNRHRARHSARSGNVAKTVVNKRILVPGGPRRTNTGQAQSRTSLLRGSGIGLPDVVRQQPVLLLKAYLPDMSAPCLSCCGCSPRTGPVALRRRPSGVPRLSRQRIVICGCAINGCLLIAAVAMQYAPADQCAVAHAPAVKQCTPEAGACWA